MYRRILIAALLLTLCAAAPSCSPKQEKTGSPALKPSPEWLARKYSMFIHFGLYSQLGGVWNGEPVREGYSEQIRSFAGISEEEYAAIADTFNPVKWDADSIVSLAKAAGMKSIVFTSKHHDGFCMYGSRYTDFNIVDATPFGRDVMKELSDACRRQGLSFAVYFSLIDWNFPGNVITPHNADPISPEHHRFNMNQVREIMTGYGPVSEIWFDMGSLTAEQSRELYDLVTSLQPQCMISGRLGNDMGDFSVMSDNRIPDYKIGTPWQTPASFFNETWSYRSWQERGSIDDKVHEKLLDLIKVVSRGGNYLLNIGPRGDGSVVGFERDALLRMGKWMDKYGEAIYGTEPNPFDRSPEWGDITRKGNNLYLFIENMPDSRTICVDGIIGNVREAVLPGNGRHIGMTVDSMSVKITIPQDVQPDEGLTVIRLTMDEGFRTVPDKILETPVLTPGNAVPVYAYSSMDYYSSFRSTVGYTWHFLSGAETVVPTLTYTAGEEGGTVRLTIDGHTRDILLQGGKPEPLPGDSISVQWKETIMYGPQKGLFRDSGTIPEGNGAPIVGLQWGEAVDIPVEDKESVFFRHTVVADKEGDILVSIGVADGFRAMLNGETVSMRTFTGGIERKPQVLKLHLQPGENILTVELYNRYGDVLQYMIDPSIPQIQYSLPIEAVKLYPGRVHDCTLSPADPVNRNSDMGLRGLSIGFR